MTLLCVGLLYEAPVTSLSSSNLATLNFTNREFNVNLCSCFASNMHITVHLCVHVCMHVCVHVRAFVCVWWHACACVHACVRACVRACMRELC